MAKGKKGAIVIGIESSECRYSEYNPYATVEEIKVWVDSNYWSLEAPEYHTIAGASLVGLLAYYTLMKYPVVFRSAILLFPLFWVNEEVYQLHEDMPDLSEKKIYLSVGSLEG